MDWLFDLIIGGLFAKLFKAQPMIKRQGNLLVAASGWQTHLFTLGFYGRRLVIDPHDKSIDLRVRRFWFFVSRKYIPFSKVRKVFYGYQDLAEGSLQADHRAEDVFIVGVELQDLTQLDLFKFAGEGAYVNEVWPDWMYPEQKLLDHFVDQDQEQDSSNFADSLSSLIGVPVGMYRP